MLMHSHICSVWAWERRRITPSRFLAECIFVLLYFALFTF